MDSYVGQQEAYECLGVVGYRLEEEKKVGIEKGRDTDTHIVIK